jgi:hypothetical protein
VTECDGNARIDSLTSLNGHCRDSRRATPSGYLRPSEPAG